ncbi:transporter substrate-binding domain-containing protein [Terasakiella sp. A23]|uniref:transporter substrate-binding domain-containing protein n=1 Tax=Terasakiella sp. FCG-A23 TaxID=3080561 RepID=UPI0029551BF5|nr:transporter substrate-binding domain-containing protein [Terasakiella sp. A23]MDV7340145.1 transporter substrate-binding domain-containing protein [Terasakiella sp. A23]
MIRRILLSFFLGLFLWTSPVVAADEDKGLKVGLWEIEPFVMKGPDGDWTGLAIEVWEEVARELGFDYHYVVYDHYGLLEAVKKGDVDVGLADIPADHDFEEFFEYSRTYFHSDLAIASRADAGSTVLQVLDTLTSPTVLKVMAVMLLIVFLTAGIFWVVERHQNDEVYDDRHRKFNFFNGALWAMLLITAQEPDVFKNKSFIGRIVGMLVLVIGVTVSASYIALITSSLTVSEMTATVRGAEDLPHIKVASLSDSRASEYLDEHHLKHNQYETLGVAMTALAEKRVDAVVADEVELRYYVRKHAEQKLSVIPVHLETEYYALAFPEWSDLPAQVNTVILQFIESPLWKELLKRHLGNLNTAS